MHIHCILLVLKETTNVLQLMKIRTEIQLQSFPKNSQQFNKVYQKGRTINPDCLNIREETL